MTPVLATSTNFTFMVRTISLFESIQTFSPECILHVLCLDDASYHKFNMLSIKNIIPIHVDTFFKEDPEALLIKKTHLRPLHSKKQNELNFFWSIGAPFTHYILNKFNYNNISFLDSDVLFYSNIENVFEKMHINNTDVGVFENLNSFKDRDDGYFGDQVVCFNNNERGRSVLRWWRDAVIKMEPKELAVLGGQKFLDGFFNVAGREAIYVGSRDFAHGDPTYYRFYNWEDYLLDGTLRWGYEKKPLMWIHFTHRHAKMLKETIIDYKPSRLIEERVKIHSDLYKRKADLLLEDILIKSIPELSKLYSDYYNTIDSTAQKYNLPKQSYSEIYYQIKE